MQIVSKINVTIISGTSLRVVCYTAVDNQAQDDRLMLGREAQAVLSTHGECGDGDRDEDMSEKASQK